MATYYVANYGSNTNNGTSPSTPWLTVQFALGAASGTNPGLTAGDTVWIAPGTYRESITSTTLTGTAGNTIKIYGDPKFTQAWTAGSASRVRLTNYTSDTSLPTASQTLAIIGDYVDIQDLCVDGHPANVTAANTPSQTCFFIRGGNNSVTRCTVQTSNEQRQIGFQVHFLAGKRNCVVSQCTFMSSISVWVTSAAQTSPFDTEVTIKDCLVISGNDYGILLEGATSSVTGARVYNNTVINSAVAAIFFINHSAVSGTTTVVSNNLIYSLRGVGMGANTSITITQSNNSIIGTSTFSNVNPTTNNLSAPMLDFGTSRVQQFSTFPWFSPMSGSPLIGAGTATGAPTVDLYGNTWTSTPTIGAIESKIESVPYVPTERNASTITIAPGSTSQSIELYLGATGLTASTAGLSARYNRTRTASVAITLVARTIAQAWTSGGFAEVDSTNMPGVYRLDIPDAALAAGADDVTIVVRGASGTNGAVMTVKLSSGGLTSAQTAAAVWDEPYTSHTAANSFGARSLLTTVDNRPVVVGTSQHIHANVHAISDSTVAADELEGALLHNGTDYISAELLTPVSAATSVHIGPYQLLADGLGADQPLDVNVGTATSIDVQVTDANGTGIDITGATVSAKVYNSGGTLVATYAGTATYADNGRLSFGLTTTVTNTSGTYTVTVTRTTGATDTQIFGPLRLYVRPV